MSKLTAGTMIATLLITLALSLVVLYQRGRISDLRTLNEQQATTIATQALTIQRDAKVLAQAQKARGEAVAASQSLRAKIKELENDKGFTDWSRTPLPSGLRDTSRN